MVRSHTVWSSKKGSLPSKLPAESCTEKHHTFKTKLIFVRVGLIRYRMIYYRPTQPFTVHTVQWVRTGLLNSEPLLYRDHIQWPNWTAQHNHFCSRGTSDDWFLVKISPFIRYENCRLLWISEANYLRISKISNRDEIFLSLDFFPPVDWCRLLQKGFD